MEFIDFKLPEIVFLEPSEHLGNELKGRTVIQHNVSHTVLEVVALDDVDGVNFNTGIKTYEFEFLNIYGLVENHLFAVHFTLDEDRLPEIFIQCSEWYREYLRWEDRNIIEDEE